MKHYAMILQNQVIEVVEANNPPQWGPDPNGNPVIAVECDETIDTNKCYDFEIKTFYDYVPPPYIPTMEELILEKVEKNYKEVQQNAIDDYTLNLIEEGIL